MATYYIGADLHCNNTELAIESRGKVVRRYSVPTTIRAIGEVLDSLSGKKHMVFEEGPMAGWLYRNLVHKVEQITVCDPRRNKLIASDGDKDDKIDAAKLAALLRGGYLRAVYHSLDEGRVAFKSWVGLYDGRVKDATRNINKVRACCRMCGIKVPRAALRDVGFRQKWLCTLKDESVAEQLRILWIGYDATATQSRLAKKQVSRLAKQYKIIGYWSELPGVGLIRAATIFAYLDTPRRFRKKNSLWKYCGVGLQRQASGTDRQGRVRPARLKMAWAVNKRLKNAVMGAATSAIRCRDNVFRRDYERMIRDGMRASNARHAVARKMVTVMWGMWKHNCRFDERFLLKETCSLCNE